VRTVSSIIVHHTATPQTWTLEKIRAFHKTKWSEIGYHYVIERDPLLLRVGRRSDRAGAHCKGANRNSLGIVIVGNFEEETLDRQTLCFRSSSGRRSVRELRAYLFGCVRTQPRARGDNRHGMPRLFNGRSAGACLGNIKQRGCLVNLVGKGVELLFGSQSRLSYRRLTVWTVATIAMLADLGLTADGWVTISLCYIGGDVLTSAVGKWRAGSGA